MILTTNDPRIDQMLTESNPRNIPDFAYFGDLPMGETWAWTFGTNRDADALVRSNWDVITFDMQSRFPDDTDIFRAGHWACGWVEQLSVRVLNDDGTMTDAGQAVLDWMDHLDNYPVADDEHFSDLEYSEWLEYVTAEIKHIMFNDYEEIERQDDEDAIIQGAIDYLTEHHCTYIEGTRYDYIEDAVAHSIN